MSSAIVIPFMVPAAVAFILISLLIKERNNYIPNRNRVEGNKGREETTNKSDEGENRPYYEKFMRNNRNNMDDFLDLSGGMMGI